MKPEDALFSLHNIDKIAGSALTAQEVRERADDLEYILAQPDQTEEVGIGLLNTDTMSLVAGINFVLNRQRHLTFMGDRSNTKETANVKLFKPHEIATSESHPGVEFATSVIAFDLIPTYVEGKDATDAQEYMVLFKLGYTDEDLTSSDLRLGVNTQFGAFIEKGKIRPFALEVATERKVVSQLERPDPASATGVSVDASIVQNGPESMKIIMLDEGQDVEKYSAIIDELKTFIAYRKSLLDQVQD